MSEVRATILPDSPSGNGRRYDVDQFLAANLSRVQAEQSAFFATAGKFFQCLSPVAEPPEPGERATPDYEIVPTSGRGKALDDLAVYLPTTYPCTVRVDEYDGPAGAGWVIGLELIEDDGRRYRKSVGFGPEAEARTREWGEAADVTL